eukprot:jgi/Bigna1/69939/fgenesh1_pg.10_\
MSAAAVTIAKNLAGRVAIVTGGAGGIGKAVAKRLHQSGARVAVCDINKSNGMKIVDEIKEDGGTAAFVHTDVTRHASIKSMVEEVGTRFGRIDILVNNAASFIFGHLVYYHDDGHGSGTGTDRNISSDDWNRVIIELFLGPQFHPGCCSIISELVPFTDLAVKHRWLLPLHRICRGVTTINAGALKKSVLYLTHIADPKSSSNGSRGAIVNVCSISSFIAQPEFVPYNVTKAGILVMTKCTAMDLAGYKIRVNAISPGTVETAGSYNHMNLVVQNGVIGLDIEEGKRMFATATLLQRQAAPEEVANGIAFLASDESSYMTGANIVMDGGQTI